MANLYTYLIASLPMLHFGMKPPFSLERFLKMCEEFIPEKDFRVLNALPQAAEYAAEIIEQPVVRQWVEFDTALRNELVKIRASRKHSEAGKYLRKDYYTGSGLAPLALSAQRNPSLLEAEKMLDEARWRTLEDLAFGHYFDLEFLIIYAYKLRILKRWEKIDSVDKTALLEQTLPN